MARKALTRSAEIHISSVAVLAGVVFIVGVHLEDRQQREAAGESFWTTSLTTCVGPREICDSGWDSYSRFNRLQPQRGTSF